VRAAEVAGRERIGADRTELDDAAHAGGTRGAQRVELEVGLVRRDRREQEERGAAREGALESDRLREVSRNHFDAEPSDLLRFRRIADDRPHRLLHRTEHAHDFSAAVTGGAEDEVHDVLPESSGATLRSNPLARASRPRGGPF